MIFELACGRKFTTGSYVVSQDIYWFETICGKCLHKRKNQRSNHYMRRGVTGNTTYLGYYLVPRVSHTRTPHHNLIA